jgi:hypothetical protein
MEYFPEEVIDEKVIYPVGSPDRNSSLDYRMWGFHLHD